MFVVLVIFIIRLNRTFGSNCLGLECENGGVVTISEDDGNCKCSCPPGKFGILCEYVIRKSSFPNGPYALPMSKYGCPEGPEQGWDIGYINITTRHSLRDANSYPQRCQDFVTDIQKTFKMDGQLLRTNILGPFDRYTVQLNFCNKLQTDNASPQAWFGGIYGVFGSSNGCPTGFTGYPLTLCLPRLLHYNIDGNVPYFDIRAITNGTELQFTYCKHEIGSTVGSTIDSKYPYMVIKDPQETETRCPKFDGYRVNIESFPEPLPAIIQINSNNSSEDIFQLRYCHVLPFSTGNFSNALSMKYTLLFAMNEGFPGLAFNFMDITAENHPCEDMKNCSVGTISRCMLGECGIVQSWILIDVRQEVLVSAIMIIAGGFNIRKFPVDIANMIVSKKKWDIFNDGGFTCSNFEEDETYDFYHARTCEKPQRGRYLTLISRTRARDTDVIRDTEDIFRGGNAWQYSKTVISVLVYDQLNVLTMEKQFQTIPVLNESSSELASSIQYLDIESQSCKQELGIQDYGIWDTQFSASSWQPLHLPSHVRPQSAGWCADVSDMKPFLQVNLLFVTLVDGFVIYNWLNIIDYKDDNVYTQEVKRMGTSSFHVYYGTSLQTLQKSQEFRCDLSRKITEKETFVLREPFNAKYIQIYPKRFPESGFPCLKIEILGCRNSDHLSLQCSANPTRSIFKMDQIYVSAYKPGSKNLNTTSIKCEEQCLYKYPGCVSAYYTADESSCTLYFDDNNHKFVTMKRGNPSDVLFMVTCLIDETGRDSRLTSYWWLFKEYNVTETGFLTSLGYPLTYTYNAAYRWKLDFPSKTLLVRFLDISLRSFEDSEKYFINNMYCRDSVILKAYPKGVGNVGYQFQDFFQVDDLNLYGAVTSDQNGQYPMFPMGHYPSHLNLFPKGLNVSEIPEEFTIDYSFYIVFYSCSYGTVLNLGRGFRLHVSVPETAMCAEYHIPFSCSLTEMTIISNRFLGQDNRLNQQWEIYVSQEPDDSIIILIEFLDFDISCHRGASTDVSILLVGIEVTIPRDSSLELSSEFGEKHVFCNGNRPFGKVLYLHGIYKITHVSNLLQSEYEYLFPEGFRLSYKGVPRLETLPSSLQISTETTEDSTYSSKVCIGAIQKCFFIYMLDDVSWEDVYKMCTDIGMTMINLKSMDEMAVSKSILLDFIRKDKKHRIATEIFIGLQRYQDTSGSMYEYWTDGSPLSFTAWDKGEPSGIYLNKCTKMGFIKPSRNDTWMTQLCGSKPQRTIAVCEKITSRPNEAKQVPQFDLNVENVAFTQRDLSTVYKCTSGEWISSLARCNDITECLDASDEMNCSDKETRSCTDDEYKCTDGRCIHISMVCDFKDDCVDSADEFCDNEPCANDQYKCRSGQCIHGYERCNSIENCFDGSDEMNCDECSPLDTFQCLDRACIPSRLVCDMVQDCTDGSDELSCDRNYTTCEDLLNNGISQNGYFQMDQGYFIYCDFENITNGGDWLHMTILNTDWKQLAHNIMTISTAGATIAIKSGFSCSQKLGLYPQRETEEYLRLEGQAIVTEEYEYDFVQMGVSSRLRINPKGLYIRHNLSTFDIIKVDNYFAESDDGRIKFWNVQCKKLIQRKEPDIHCRTKVSPVNKSYQCLYDNGWKEVTRGCRSLAHLQNCANVSCPRDFMKCPMSYCIPMMYVCDGKVDCPDGYDEKMCGCKQFERSVIIVVPDKDDEGHQNIRYIANRFGASLFSNGSTVMILSTDYQSVQESSVARSRKLDADTYVSFTRMNVLMNSQHTLDTFKRYSVKTGDIRSFLKQLITAEGYRQSSGVVWLIDDTSIENETVNLISGFRNLSLNNHFNYLLVKNPSLRTHVTIKNDQFIKVIKIRQFDILGTIGNQFLPEICSGGVINCKGRYRCSMSKVCIPSSQICDGSKQCTHGDDELNCDFKCPSICTCRTLVMNCSHSNERGMTINKYTPTRVLDLTNSPNLCQDILENNETRSLFRSLISLNMSTCSIKYISRTSFDFSVNLKILDLSFNEIRLIPSYAFNVLKVLEILLLEGNSKLMFIEPLAFYGTLIHSLTISGSELKTLKADTFYGLKLKYLDITRNKISSVKDGAFNLLESSNIDIRFNPIKDFTKQMFFGLTNVEKLETPAFKFCCIRPSDLSEDDCYPHKDEFSSCEDLMRNSTLQALMWTIGILAFVGNVMSLIYRLVYDKKRLKLGYGIFVTNLAIADLLMGVYMLLIATADKLFRDRYIEVDEYWRNSAWCKMAGIFSTVSSEASVLFMCLITIDRILIIKYPFGQVRFKERSATIAVVSIWIFVIFISLLPIVYTGYFKGQFYSKSGVCLALPLTRDRQPGWLYSILLFIGFNMITFIMIAVGQLLIYTEIKKASSVQKSLTTTRTNDLKVARNLLLVVTTDFLCWFPIGMMGCLALTGHVIPGEVYAWTAVFVLPVNSALNPFMYTLTAIYNSKKFSPSLDEKSRKDPMKEMGKAILEIYPYVPTCHLPRQYVIVSLDDWINEGRLKMNEAMCLLYRIVKFMTISHGYNLVLRKLVGNNVNVVVLKKRNVLRRIYMDVQLHQGIASNKKEMAENMYQFGCLLDKMMSKTLSKNI